MQSNINTVLEKIDSHHFATFMWAGVYEELIKNGVVFPENFDGVGASYSGALQIKDNLKNFISTSIQQLLAQRDEEINRLKGELFEANELIERLQTKSSN